MEVVTAGAQDELMQPGLQADNKQHQLRHGAARRAALCQLAKLVLPPQPLKSAASADFANGQRCNDIIFCHTRALGR